MYELSIRKTSFVFILLISLLIYFFIIRNNLIQQYFGYTVSNNANAQENKSISGTEDIAFKIQSSNGSTSGLSLNSSTIYVISAGLSINKFVELTPDNAGEFVVVTAANEGYFHVDMDAIANVQKMLPNHTIIFYDLSLQRNSDEVTKIKQLCNVIYRQFNFSKYPPHVKDLVLYAWKPLIVNEVLLEYPGVFWIDSSGRFVSSNLTGLYQKFIRNGGIMTFGYSSHNIFSATHEGMYRYLPIPRDQAIRVRMYDANSIYFYRTQKIYHNVVRWWTACALVRGCIASMTNRFCRFKPGAARETVFAECHRFDQAAVNILMAIYYKYDDTAYLYTDTAVTTILRGSQGKEQLMVCSPNGQMRKIGSYKYFRSA